MYDHYDISGFIENCMEKSKPNVDDLKKFETTDNFDNLPNTKEVRDYFLCLLNEARIIKPNSSKLELSEFMGLVAKMKDEDIDKYHRLIKGCPSKVHSISDPIEVAYQLMVCQKRNAIDVIEIFNS